MTSARVIRVLAVLAAVTTCLGGVRAARAQAITAQPGGALSAPVGVTLDVPIVLDMGARPDKVGAFAGRLAWSPSVLRFDGGADGSFGSLAVALDSTAQGVIRLSGANPTGASGVITLGIARFTALIPDTTTLRLTISQLYAAGTFADLLPSLSVTNGQFCPARGQYGDINQDAAVNSADALIAVTHAVGLSVGTVDIALGDVDADGSTGTRDALGILSHAVGLPTTGFRILITAAGGCTTNPSAGFAILPNAVGQLVAGQMVRFEARVNPAGTPQSVLALEWLSGNPAVATVDSLGRVTAVAPGSTVIRAIREHTDTTQVVLTVVARRTTHYVDAAALQQTNRVGTIAFPFDHVQDAIRIASAGDTVVIRPGRYSEADTLDKDVLLLGDTAANGARPEIFADGAQGSSVALTVSGPGIRRVQNLAFSEAYAGIAVRDGVTRADFSGLRMWNVSSGILTDSIGTLNVRKSQLLGDRNNGYGSGIGDAYFYYSRADTLRIEDSEVGEFSGYAVVANNFGLLEVTRSLLRDSGNELVYAGNDDSATTAGFNITVDSSRLRATDDDALYVYGFNTITIRHSTIQSDDGVGIDASYGKAVILVKDSIIINDEEWIDGYDFDSLVVDSVTADLRDAYGGYVYNVPRVRLTNSSFVNLYDGILDVSYGGTQRPGDSVIVRDNVFRADQRYNGYSDGLYVEDAHLVVENSQFYGLYAPIEGYGDSTLLAQHNIFEGAEYAVQFYGYGNGSARPRATVTHNTFRNTQDYEVEIYDAQVVVDSNTIVNGGDGIEIGTQFGAQVTRNRIQTLYRGIYVEGYDSTQSITVTDNVVNTLYYEAVSLEGEGNYPRIRFDVQRDTVVCGNLGGSSYAGIRVRDADALVAANHVQNCGSGISVEHPSSDSIFADSIIGNSVIVQRGGDVGIRMEGAIRGLVRRNTVVGDSSVAMNRGGMVIGRDSYCQYYYPNCLPVYVVDSNTVQRVATNGILLTGADSIVVRDNFIADVAHSVPNGYDAGISINSVNQAYLFGINRYALIRGNDIQRMSAAGISVYTADSGIVHIDSNRVKQNRVGIQVADGNVDVSRNRITGNAHAGVEFMYASSGVASRTLTNNNIAGNAFGVYEPDANSVNAANNWWGDALGPRCGSCDQSSTGDSVQGLVTYTPFLAAEFGATPSPAPRPRFADVRPVTMTAAAMRSGAARPERAVRVRQQPPASITASAPGAVRAGQQLVAARAAQRVSLRQAQVVARAERTRLRAERRQARVAEKAHTRPAPPVTAPRSRP